MIKTVQRTELSVDWKSGTEEKAVAELNDDFAKMDIPLRVEVRADGDGVTIFFTKETEE